MSIGLIIDCKNGQPATIVHITNETTANRWVIAATALKLKTAMHLNSFPLITPENLHEFISDLERLLPQLTAKEGSERLADLIGHLRGLETKGTRWEARIV